MADLKLFSTGCQMTDTREIWGVNETYRWLREPLLARLPDGSLCCAFFTGGRGDGDLRNVVAAVRSDDDGETWSEPEILVRHRKRAGRLRSMSTETGPTCSGSHRATAIATVW